MKRSTPWIILLTLLLVFVGSPAKNDPAVTTTALQAALDDERRSEATYRAVLAGLGDVRPFSNIVHAEQCHAGQLVSLFESRGLEVPTNGWGDKQIEVAGTLTEACAEAIESEQANVALYDEWLPQIEDADVVAVFNRLRLASLDHHLPAFERCAEGKPMHGAGGGKGGGKGAGCGGGKAGGGGCCGACRGGNASGS